MDRQKAFTVAELIIALAIIIILSAVVVLPFSKVVKQRARKTWAASEIHQLDVALKLYAEDWGTYPHDDEEPIDGCKTLVDALEKKSGNGPYCEWPADAKHTDGNLLDPWGRSYRYRYNSGTVKGKSVGAAYNIYSAGIDGTYDNADDIKNW
jgi:type II secretory pathway pseudopilin PulG